jgi:hypothetical protein
VFSKPLSHVWFLYFQVLLYPQFVVLRLGWNIKQSVRGADRVMEENIPLTFSLLH